MRPVPAHSRARSGLGSVDVTLLALTLALIALVVLPAFIRSTVSLEIQRCWAQQRRIHAAVDAYETDTHTRLPDLEEALPLLVKNGYLSGMPEDPGDERPASVSHYGRNGDGAVYCWVHGSPWPQSATPVREPQVPRLRQGPAWPPPPPPPTDPRPMIKKVPGFWR